MTVTLIQATPDPITTISDIASICYDSKPKDPLKLVDKLYYSGHHGVVVHSYFAFKIGGISRACSHQLGRHRHCSFTQRSQRYCSEDGFKVILPPSIEKDYLSECDYEHILRDIDEAYAELQNNGIPNEDARYILPNACATSLYLSCNLRELIHIANERLCNRAQWEIRELVKEMIRLVPEALHFMLVPKCQSGRIICHEKCGGMNND